MLNQAIYYLRLFIGIILHHSQDLIVFVYDCLYISFP